ncbi:MAG: hypothetical protein Tsb005_05650 [Gammaproteobacteria bacterium]
MTDQDNNTQELKQIAEDLLAALDKAIHEGPWQQGRLFQNIGKQLEGLRTELSTVMEQEFAHTNYSSPTPGYSAKHQPNVEADEQVVYISVYNAAGQDLEKWAKIISSLANSNVTRPIYQNEEDLRVALRAKPDKTKDGYIIATVLKQNIIQPKEGPPLDRFGHPLVTIKPGAIHLDKISKFMHKSGEYQFESGQLIRMGEQPHVDFL